MQEYPLRHDGARWELIYGSYDGVARFAVQELQASVQTFLPYVIRCVPAAGAAAHPKQHAVLIGTPGAHSMIAELAARHLITIPDRPQAYTIACMASPWAADHRVLVVAGRDDAGLVYGVTDLHARVLAPLGRAGDHDPQRLRAHLDTLAHFSISEFPLITNRGIWTWGYVVYDYRSFITNMARMKMNMLTIWNDQPPLNIDDIISHAHARGVKIVLGFPWGWGMNLDVNSAADRRRIMEMVLRDYETHYRHLALDGIYFQTLTEHHTTVYAGRPLAAIVCEMVNEIASELFKIHPHLRIQFGLHATSIQDHYVELAALDPRVTIVWEDAGAIPYAYAPEADNPHAPEGFRTFEQTVAYSVKLAAFRPGTEFAMVPKGWTCLDWAHEFEHHGPFILGERERQFIRERCTARQVHWDRHSAMWARNYALAVQFYREMLKCQPSSMTVTGLIEDGLFEAHVQPSAGLFAETLWNAERAPETILRLGECLSAAANERI